MCYPCRIVCFAAANTVGMMFFPDEQKRKYMGNLHPKLAGMFAAVCVFLAASAVAGGEPGGAVKIGRVFKATPWVEHLEGVPFEKIPYQSLAVAQAIPAESEFYTIDPEVAAAGYSYFFRVDSPDATYLVGSVVNLFKLTHELGVIAEIRKRSKSKEFTQGVTQSVKGIGTGLAHLVAHPGLSLKNAGNRLRQTGRSLEQAVDGETIGTDESGVDRSQLGSGPAGGARRVLAYELGVDVYTSNPVLREVLNEYARVYAAGTFATWAIPYNLGTLAYFNPLAGDEKTEILIRDNSPYELRRSVGMELEPIFRMMREDKYRALHAFLNNPNFSPRMVAYAGADFQRLRETRNLELALNKMAGASTPEEADMAALTLRLYSLLHRNIVPVAEIRPFKESLAAVGADGMMYIMVPVDTLRPWNRTSEMFAELLDEAHGLGVTGLQIWSVGDVAPSMVENAARHGVAVRQNILADPKFYHLPAAVRPEPTPGN